MRGNYTIIQKTGQNTSGTLSLAFVDKEDQAITYWFDNYNEIFPAVHKVRIKGY